MSDETPWNDPGAIDNGMIDDPEENERRYQQYKGCCLGSMLLAVAYVLWASFGFLGVLENRIAPTLPVIICLGAAIYYFGRSAYASPGRGAWMLAILVIVLMIVAGILVGS